MCLDYILYDIIACFSVQLLNVVYCVRSFLLCTSLIGVLLFLPRIPHLLPLNYAQEQFNPPPFNYNDPALHYSSHCSPRIIDTLAFQKHYRRR